VRFIMASSKTRSAKRSNTATVSTPPTGDPEATVAKATDTPDTAPTGAADGATPDTPETPDTAPTGAADGADGADGADAKPGDDTPPDPIEKLRTERTEAQAEITSLLADVGKAAASGDTAEMLKLSAQVAALQGNVDRLTLDIREDGYAMTALPLVAAALLAIPETDRSQGEQAFRLVTVDGVLKSLTRVTLVAVGASGKSRSTKKAALKGGRSDKTAVRLPPAGVTLHPLTPVDWPHGKPRVTFTEGNAVIVEGSSLSGAHRFDRAEFSSVSKACAALREQISDNGYETMGLPKPSGSWPGYQVHWRTGEHFPA
jgi:hypothetical protein